MSVDDDRRDIHVTGDIDARQLNRMAQRSRGEDPLEISGDAIARVRNEETTAPEPPETAATPTESRERISRTMNNDNSTPEVLAHTPLSELRRQQTELQEAEENRKAIDGLEAYLEPFMRKGETLGDVKDRLHASGEHEALGKFNELLSRLETRGLD